MPTISFTFNGHGPVADVSEDFDIVSEMNKYKEAYEKSMEIARNWQLKMHV